MLWLTLLLTASPDAGSCAVRSDCALDTISMTCSLATVDLKGEGGAVNEPADTCICEKGECTRFTVEPVPCTSFKDCSLTREPFLHPVSSKKVRREHQKRVRPCKDAEEDSVCDLKTKTCRIEHWTC